MKKHMKLWSLILCLTLVISPASALFAAINDSIAYMDTLEQLAAIEARKELFTLEKIRSLARDKGAETQQAQTSLAIAQASKDSADIDLSNAQWKAMELLGPAITAMGADESVVSAYTKQENAVTSLEDAKATLESKKWTAEYTGEKLFFDYLQLQDSLILLEKSIDISQEQLRIEQLKAKLGLSTATDVQKQSLALDELMDKKQSLIIAIDMTGRNLMRQIGKPLDTAFRLDASFSIKGMKEDYDPDALADLTIKNNLNLGVLIRNINKNKDNLNTLVMSPSARGTAGAQLDSMILNRDTLTQNMRLLARSTATGLVTSKANISLLEKTLEDKKTALKVTSLQVSLGLAPKLGLMGAETQVLTAESNLLKARQNYYLALRRAELLVKGVAIS